VPEGAPEKFRRATLSPGKHPHSIDVFHAKIDDNDVPYIQLWVLSNHPTCRLIDHGIYRLTVKASPDGTKHEEIALLVDWRGDIANIDVRRELT
jgi:hypothetical protein